MTSIITELRQRIDTMIAERDAERITYNDAIADLIAANERLRALLGKLRWKSIDKDNMEFRCDTTCYVMDELRALEEKPCA